MGEGNEKVATLTFPLYTHVKALKVTSPPLTYFLRYLLASMGWKEVSRLALLSRLTHFYGMNPF